jgi:hypothetical protein
LELELEELLRGRFPTDSIEPIGKGELGADVMQQVKGLACARVAHTSDKPFVFESEAEN